MAKDLQDLDGALAARPVPEDVIAYRGSEGLRFDRPIDQLVGSVQENKGYLPTWVGRPGSSGDWGGRPVHLTLRVPKGTPALYLPSVTGKPGEHELLIGRGTRMFIH